MGLVRLTVPDVDACHLCRPPASVEAIGDYLPVFGIDETVLILATS